MKREEELVPTQRLLNVVRGRYGGLSEPSPMRDGGKIPLQSEGGRGVLLSPEGRPRSSIIRRVVVGLDIGHKTVKMVKVEKGRSGLKLLQVGLAKVADGNQKGETTLEERARAAKGLLVNWRKEPIITCLGDPNTLLRQVTLPRMSPKDLEQALGFEARKHMPYEPTRMALRYQVLSEDRRRNTIQLLLVAVTRDALRELKTILDEIGIIPQAIDVTPLALANASIIATGGTRETCVVVDLGFTGTVITIHRIDGLILSRHLPIVIRGDGEPVLELGENLQELAIEIRRSMAYYDNVTGRMGFSKILLSGGGALLKEAVDFLQGVMDVPVESISPWEAVQWDGALVGGDWIRGTAPLWAQALGLAVRD